MRLERNNKIILHKYSVLEEGEYVNIGRKEINKFVRIPKVGYEFLKLLNGNSIDQTEKLFFDHFGVRLNGISFMERLKDIELIKSIDDKDIPSSSPIKGSLNWLNSKNIGWIHSNISFSIIIMIIFFLSISNWNNNLIQTLSWSNFFVSKYYSISGFLIISVLAILIIIHELSHLILARSYDVPSFISIGFRAHYLVFQTNATGLWTVNKSGRIKVYLVGLLSDFLIFSAVLFISQFFPITSYEYRLLILIVIIKSIQILWQFHVYLRTDVYYLLQEFLGQNLYKRSLEWTKRFFMSLLTFNLSDLKEDPIIKIYGIFIVLGTSISLFFSLYFGLPATLKMVIGSANQMLKGLNEKDIWLFFNGTIVILAESFLTYLLLLQWWSYIKEKLKEKKPIITKQ